MEIKVTIESLRRLEREEKLVLQGTDIVLVLDIDRYMVLGSEIRDFFDNGWDKNYYHESDDAEIQIQDDYGNWILDDDKRYDVRKLGYLCWQGGHVVREPKSFTFAEAFLAWKEGKK